MCFIFIHAYVNEHDHIAANLILKRPITNHGPRSPEYKYLQLLITYVVSRLSKINAWKITKICIIKLLSEDACVSNIVLLLCEHFFTYKSWESKYLKQHFTMKSGHRLYLKNHSKRKGNFEDLAIDIFAISVTKTTANVVKTRGQKDSRHRL